MEVGGADFAEYYSIFKTKYDDNLYSSQGEFDPTRVNRVIVFINMNREANFTGDVIVDEIAFVEELPRKVAGELGGLWGPKASMDPTWEVGEPYTVIDDCSSKDGWSNSSTNLQLELTDKTLIINSGVKGN